MRDVIFEYNSQTCPTQQTLRQPSVVQGHKEALRKDFISHQSIQATGLTIHLTGAELDATAIKLNILTDFQRY